MLSLPFMMLGMTVPASRYWHWTQHFLATPIVLWAGWPFYEKTACPATGLSNAVQFLFFCNGEVYGWVK